MKQKYSILDIKPFEDGDNTFSHPQAEVVTRFEEIYERFFNDDGTLVKKILQKKIEFIVNEKVILTDVLSHDQSVLNGGVLVHERILEVIKKYKYQADLKFIDTLVSHKGKKINDYKYLYFDYDYENSINFELTDFEVYDILYETKFSTTVKNMKSLLNKRLGLSTLKRLIPKENKIYMNEDIGTLDFFLFSFHKFCIYISSELARELKGSGYTGFMIHELSYSFISVTGDKA